MENEDLNFKIKLVGISVIVISLVIIIIGVSISDNNLQKQIDENRCIIGGSCPEINSILPNKINDVLGIWLVFP